MLNDLISRLAPLLSAWERLECFAVINPRLHRQHRHLEKELERVYAKRRKDPIAFKRLYDQWRGVDLALRVGFPVGKELEAKLEMLKSKGLTDRDLRTLINNRILERDGTMRVSKLKEKCCIAAGWIGISAGIAAFVLTAGLIWLSPLGINSKLLLSPYSMFFLLYAGVMCCYTIKPTRVLKGLGYL